MKKRLVALATIIGLIALSPVLLPLAVLIAERQHLSRHEKRTREIS